MFLSKLKVVAVISLVAAVLAGVALGACPAGADQAPATKPAAPPAEVRVAVPAQEQPPEKGKQDPPAVSALKERLKKYEDEIVKLRAAMIKECEQEVKRLEAAIKAAQKEQAEAKGDRKKAFKAQQEASALQMELFKVKQLGHKVEASIRVGPKPAFDSTADQRLGLRLGAPSGTVANQLRLDKDTGMVVEFLAAGSVADKAGLKKHDVLVSIDGKAVPNNLSGANKLLAETVAVAAAEVVVLREGKQVTIRGLKIP